MRTNVYRVRGLACGGCLAQLLERVRHLVGMKSAAVEDAGLSLYAPATESATFSEV